MLQYLLGRRSPFICDLAVLTNDKSLSGLSLINRVTSVDMSSDPTSFRKNKQDRPDTKASEPVTIHGRR